MVSLASSVGTVEIPRWLEVIAIIAGALAGSARGVKDQLAVSGVVALAVAGGLGGGIIRDILLQVGTPVAFTDSWLLGWALVASVPALLLAPVVRHLEWPMYGVGALSLGIYSVLGADKALLYGIPPVGAMLIGVTSGTGGSVLADLAVGVPPALFRPGKLQGMAAAVGTVAFVLGAYYTDARAAWFIVGVVIITSMRMVSLVAGIHDAPADQYATYSEGVLKKIPHPTPPSRVRNVWRRKPPSGGQASGGEDP